MMSLTKDRVSVREGGLSGCGICSRSCEPSGRRIGGYDLYWCSSCDLYFAPNAFGALPDYDKAYSTPAYIRNQVEQIRRAKDKSVFARIPTYEAFFQKESSERERRTLLDVGCGVGRFCHAAHAAGWDVTGIDISQSAISIGSSLAPFALNCLSLDDLAGDTSHYAVVTAFEVVEHLPSPIDFVRKASRLLIDGGTFFFTVPNWNCRLVRNATHYDAVPPYHVNFFTETACVALLQASGFTDIRSGIILVDRYPSSLRHFPKWAIGRLLARPQDRGVWAAGDLPAKHLGVNA